MNYLLWAEFVGNLVTVVAQSQGADSRAINYLNVLTSGVRAATLTDVEFEALKAKYEADVANDTPVTQEELSDLAALINANSATIQGD